MASISAPGLARGRAGGTSLRTALRRVAEAAVTPLELDDVLDVFHPLRGGRDGLRGRIVSVTSETAESATIVVKPGRDWAGHVPGQYVRVGVDVDGVRLWRTYSLTHGPRRDRNLSFTVKAIPGGVGLQPPRAPRPGRPDDPARAGRGRVRAADADPAQAAAGHRRLRHHAGDRDAAQPVLPPGAGRHRHHPRARQPERVVRDLPRRAPGPRHGRPPPAGRAVRRPPRHPRRRPPRGARARPGRAAHLRLRAGRPARRAREAPRRPRPLAHHRAVPPGAGR